MKQLLKISEMMPFLPTALKDAIHHVAKDTGNATDALELHRHTHSEKAKVNELDPASRKSLAYVSYRTQDRDDEIVIPKSLKLDEFRKYSSVLVNHNYSLLPVGSDEWIDADDYGIKALTIHADTGAGTMANVVWDLVRQGHLKGRSVGFVPTSFTKPGARDWDHVANQLQSNWKEFDKGRAEKSVSRIITGGVLLEHSFVSVPCNTDAELIGVVKSMNLDGKIIKQLGLEEKQEKVPSVCDECGYVSDAVPGSKCPECKTGDMKTKGKEKAYEIRVVSKGGPGSGNFGHSGRPGEVGGSGEGGGDKLTGKETDKELERKINGVMERASQVSREKREIEHSALEQEMTRTGSFADELVGFDEYKKDPAWQKLDREEHNLYEQRNALRDAQKKTPEGQERQRGWDTLAGGKSFHSRAVEKPNPHMPGGSFSACVLIMEDKGHDTESAKKICGALQADAGGKGLTEAETKAVREAKGEGGIPCTCDECGAEDECAPGSPCQEADCEGVMRASKRMEKGGPGSGNFGHSGRPGEVGGSGEGGESAHADLSKRAFTAESHANRLAEESRFVSTPEKHKETAQAYREASRLFRKVQTSREQLGHPESPLSSISGRSGQELSQYFGTQADLLDQHAEEHERMAEKKSFHSEIKVVRPAPQIKVLYVPPDADLIAKGVSDAVEKTLARRTGKIL